MARTGRSPTPTSRPTTTSSRTTSASRAGRGRARAARRPVPAADGDDVRGDALRTRVKAKLGRTRDDRADREHHARRINGRQPCHYCGPCERGCATRSYFNSAFTTVPDALATGNCTLDHRRDGLQGPDRTPTHRRARASSTSTGSTREPKEISGARRGALRAGARVGPHPPQLRDPQYPNGLANSSGVLGHYLMDHLWVAGGRERRVPGFRREADPRGRAAVRPASTSSASATRQAGPRTKDFLRGYGFQGGSGSRPSTGARPASARVQEARCSSPRRRSPSLGFGECLPRFDELRRDRSPGQVDAFGIPVLQIHMTWGENEKAMIPDMAESAAEMLDAAGAKNIRPSRADRVPATGSTSSASRAWAPTRRRRC